MRTLRHPLAALLFFCLGAPSSPAQETATSPARARTPVAAKTKGAFLVEPYIQLGDAAASAKSGSLQVLWHTDDSEATWSVEYRTGDASWRRAEAPTSR